MEKRILVVDDEALMRESLDEILTRKKYSVDLAVSGEEALKMMKEKEYDVILSDIRMPNLGGMEVLKATKGFLPDAKVILMTAYATVENAIEAMKLGAFDYIMKPFSPDAIEVVVEKAFEYKRLLFENKLLKSQIARQYRFENIIGRSPQMQKVFEMVDVVADSKATVFITGESGTGKELIAKAIHYNSPRKDKPFIKINCAALPENLVESELFGHEKGAFTGAIRQSRGRFELADGGTLLLDEISEISFGLQAKLLRVLQEREFERVGSGDSIQVDIRIVSTSNQDIPDLIRRGKFRADLFYRLNVIPIYLPPLREKKEDIPALAEHFLRFYNKENNRSVEKISPEVYQLFMNYPWPGNVRELENHIERALIMAKGKTLAVADFPRELVLGETKVRGEAIEVGCSIHEAEKKLILKTLDFQAGNRTKAAEVLGISTRTLRNKLQEYGLKEK